MTAARGDAAPGQSNISASVPPEGPPLLNALGFSLPAGPEERARTPSRAPQSRTRGALCTNVTPLPPA